MNGELEKHMLLLIILFYWQTLQAQPVAYPLTPSEVAATDELNHNFMNGEELEFKLSYGWFTVGKAQINIASDYQTYQKEDCYKVDIQGSTAGLLGVFTNVNDSWGAYITRNELKPLHAYRDIQEGKHIRVEKTYFDHEQEKVEVLRYDPREEDPEKIAKVYSAPRGVKDLMSAYLTLRNIDYSQYNIGDTLIIDTFYEDELYHFKLLIAEEELFESKVGKLYAYKIYLLIPTSELFPEEKGIFAWVSADSNHLPLRIEAELFFGRGYCDLISYRNIKYGPDYQE